jgi:hypothetical protein
MCSGGLRILATAAGCGMSVSFGEDRTGCRRVTASPRLSDKRRPGLPLEDTPARSAMDPGDYARISMRVIVVALGKFNEHAWLFTYRPRIMTWRQHHDVPLAELLLETVVHHHLQAP